MKIGIIGAGNIGGHLGQRWAAAGHDVVFGVRDPNSPKTQEALANAPGSRAATMRDAVVHGEVIALAVHWPVVREVVPSLGDLGGKILIDTSNRFTPPQPGDGPSAAGDIASWARNAKVVKAFNTQAAEVLLDPDFNGMAPTAFLCGDDEAAKEVVAKLAQDLGLEPINAGPLQNAPLVEGLTRLWAQMARNYGREIAFAVLRR